ncbi:hypothetical protein [Butyricicoccus pullicaecorum]|nr:hypothetical protein [Butyricicoccus pullicaecorum]
MKQLLVWRDMYLTVESESMEYRKRCKVCGKIWCYTDDDLKQDAANNLMGGINAVGQIASAFGGTVFHRKYFADRSENIDRKRVNRNQCPQCHSLDCEDISEEELEKYKTQESFSKAQIAINSNATTENLLTRAKLLLEDKDWASANAYCDYVLDTEPENGTAYLYKLMAELRVQHQEELKDKAEPFDGKVNYQKVMRYADESVKQVLSSCIEHIKDRNENERLQGIYVSACNRMKNATTESAFKEAAASFIKILGYKDAESMQQKCIEMANQARIEAEQKAAVKKVKRIRNTIIIAVIAIVAAIGAHFALNNSQKEAAYNEAMQHEISANSETFHPARLEEYKTAIAGFEALGNYKNSEEQVDEIKKTAYDTALSILNDTGTLDDYNTILEYFSIAEGYEDSIQMAQQLKVEMDAIDEVFYVEEVTDDDIEAARKIFDTNQYAKRLASFEKSVYIYEQFCNTQWEYVSGDARALSMISSNGGNCSIIKTDMSRKPVDQWWGWDRTLTIYINGTPISFDYATYINDDTNNRIEFWGRLITLSGKSDVDVVLTEQGRLHIVLTFLDGSTFECEYKRA